ncbi:molybdopterin-dependent oxidoreductase [Nocardioides acrostichi]|uniref:Molybdopterin-dependent oxidoreductase n=1 Tax=Nocardioides acrostichi TaxID=2784339 RepID=A0A930UYD0_9ACTN|nr:molybdopterin-dependent oxidoreductase [Nocardioides acrostichi]MBF4160516.1 molybdopterin-dependent oxidoreductase [Nocardioides acrostichi]
MRTDTTRPTDATTSSGTRTVHGVCHLCEAICGLLLTVESGPDGDRVTAVRGNPDDPLSRGHICPKGVALPDLHEDPERLRRPMRRVGTGADARFEPMEWDDALDLAADIVARGLDAGTNALAVYLGNPNAHALGSLTHGTALVKSLKTRNKFSATSVDQLPAQLVAHLLYGHQLMIPVPDIDRTSLFLVVGGNPMASNGSLMTVPDFPGRLRELKARGGRMVVLDPRRTETAKVADEHHFVRPGTDAYVLLAMARELLADELATPPAWVQEVESVRLAVEPFTPELAEGVSGVPAREIRRLARELAAADGAVVYGRMGTSTQEFGTVCQWAIQVLNLLTGNVDREGGALVTTPLVDVVGKGLVGRGHYDLWRSRVRGLPEFGGELPVSALREEIETPGEGQVRALLTLAGNPVLSTPDGAALGRALESLDGMVSVDVYLNETTRHADVVLPPTSALERDQYDLVFHALAVRNTARFTPAVLPAPEGTMADWEIYRELANRVQARVRKPLPRKERLTLKARMALSPARTIALLLRTHRAGVSLKKLRESGDGVDLGGLEPSFPRRLQTRDKRVHLAPDLVLADLPRLLEAADRKSGADDLLLIGRRHQRDNNSWLHTAQRLTRGKPRHHLLVHPDDLAARNILDGACVQVRSRVGAVEVEVRSSEEMMPGVVSLPHGYGHATHGSRVTNAAAMPGASVNDLTDPALLDVSGNAALNGVPVTLSPA